jgi:hypothetical protein
MVNVNAYKCSRGNPMHGGAQDNKYVGHPSDDFANIPTNPHWARVVGYDRFSLWVIHKEGLCPSSGDINRLLMMMI